MLLFVVLVLFVVARACKIPATLSDASGCGCGCGCGELRSLENLNAVTLYAQALDIYNRLLWVCDRGFVLECVPHSGPERSKQKDIEEQDALVLWSRPAVTHIHVTLVGPGMRVT